MHILQSNTTKVVLHEWNLFAKANLFPGDYHLVNLRTLNENRNDTKSSPSKEMALILRRFAYDCEETYDQSFHSEQVSRSPSDAWFLISLLLANKRAFHSCQSNRIGWANFSHIETSQAANVCHLEIKHSHGWVNNVSNTNEIIFPQFNWQFFGFLLLFSNPFRTHFFQICFLTQGNDSYLRFSKEISDVSPALPSLLFRLLVREKQSLTQRKPLLRCERSASTSTATRFDVTRPRLSSSWHFVCQWNCSNAI